MGVDVGGTNTAVAVIDHKGNLVSRKSFPTPTDTFAEWADRLTAHIDVMLEGIDRRDVAGIGIGAPCANTETGIVDGSTNLYWEQPTALARGVEERTCLHTVIANDANAAAMGEMVYGAARGLRNFIVITLGTGVGSGIVVDGHLLLGARGFAGELGHVTFDFAADRTCPCGRKGCLETVASAGGVTKTALKMLADDPERHSTLRDIPAGQLTPKHITEAAELGDELAQDVWRFTGECLGEACANFAAFADPDAVIFFGGVAKAGEWLLEPLRDSFRRRSLFLHTDRVRFLPSELSDNDAALLGAAALLHFNTDS